MYLLKKPLSNTILIFFANHEDITTVRVNADSTPTTTIYSVCEGLDLWTDLRADGWYELDSKLTTPEK